MKSICKFNLLTFLFINIAQAQIAATKIKELNIEDFCKGSSINLNGKIYSIKDDGFCNAIKDLKEENQTPDANLINDINYTFKNLDPTSMVVKKKCNMPTALTNNIYPSPNIGLNESLKTNDKTKWQIRFYASHSFTKYGKSDFEMRSSRINIDVKDLPIDGRDGREWFSPKKFLSKGHNPAQMIDEPSNTFTIGFIKPTSNSKISHEFVLTAFHPKELIHGNTPVHVVGSVDGVKVEDFTVLNKPFDGYNQTPGELEIVRNQSTYQNMIYSVGYRPRFKLLDGKAGSLIYSPGIQVGIITGKAYSAVIKEDEWWEFDEYKEPGNLNYHGFGGAITNKIEYITPGGKFGVHYENKLGHYNKKMAFLDGTQEYILKFMGNSIGMTFMIRDFNISKKERKLKKKSRESLGK